MRDVRDQIAAFTEVLDKSAPAVADLAGTAGPASPRRPGRPVWAIAGATVAVFAVVAGFATFSRTPATTSLPATSALGSGPAISVPLVTTDLLNPGAVTPAMFPGWPHPFAGPGAVTVSDGTFHMLSAAYGDGVATVAYARSDDGVVWTQGSNAPVLDLSEAPWAPVVFDFALPRSVVVVPDGTWHLFFEISFFDANAEEQRSSIGRAVAREPDGLWIFDAEPVLRPNREMPWMSREVGSPSVVTTDAGLLMLFVGNASTDGVVGVAQSIDGSSWSARPGPVFNATGNWERGSIVGVDLVGAPGGLAMFYTGDTPSRRGLAVSTDGLEWVPHPANPLITGRHVPRALPFDSEFVFDGSTVLAYIEHGGVRTDREVSVLRIGTDLEEIIELLTSG